MSYPDHLAPLFKATQRLGGGIMVLDRSWRIVYSNPIIREVYPGFAFLPDASYDDLIWHCVNSQIINSPELYADPEQYISNLKDMLSLKPLNKWICVHRNGCSYMMLAKHIFGGGSVHLCMDREKAKAGDIDDLLMVNAEVRPDAMSRLLTLAGDDILTIPLRPALELTPIAVAIVTDSGKLLECNGEFSRVLNTADSIRLTGGDIQAVDETGSGGAARRHWPDGGTRIGHGPPDSALEPCRRRNLPCRHRVESAPCPSEIQPAARAKALPASPSSTQAGRARPPRKC